MTRGNIRDFLAPKKGKGKILDEFTKVTGCHHKDS